MKQINGAGESQASTPRRSLIAAAYWVGLLFAGIAQSEPRIPVQAEFARELASNEARQFADWVLAAGDHQGRPFAIVDKKDARVFVFDPKGRLEGSAPALLGLSRGDDAVPGIGTRSLASIKPGERTTPAGRFVAEMGRNLHGEDILWVDYDGAVAMHRVITGKPKDHRRDRLATPTPLDNRITYGCINLPAAFFDKVLRPAFAEPSGIVYVLPDTKSIREVFGRYDPGNLLSGRAGT